MNHSIFSTFLLLMMMVPSCFCSWYIWPVFHLYVINELPSAMRVHCASADDDIGYHTIQPNDNIHWSFQENIFGRTLFFCHFWWGSKDQAFDVYADKHFTINSENKYLYWIAREDGFYRGYSTYKPPKNDSLRKWHDWKWTSQILYLLLFLRSYLWVSVLNIYVYTMYRLYTLLLIIFLSNKQNFFIVIYERLVIIMIFLMGSYERSMYYSNKLNIFMFKSIPLEDKNYVWRFFLFLNKAVQRLRSHKLKF